MSELEGHDFDFLNQNTPKQDGEINKVKVIIAALILLLLIGGAIYYFAKGDEKTPTPEQQEVNDVVLQEESDQEDATKDATEENTDQEVTSGAEDESTTTETENSVDETVITENTVPEEALVYFIVSGAFKEESNAQRKVDQLKSAGYNAVIVGQNANGLFIVAYEGFPDIQSAKDKLTEIRNEDQSAWIYKKVD